MRLTRGQTWVAMAFIALLAGFSLIHASWLAETPKGTPRLIADHALEPVRDASGCVAQANSGYGGTTFAPDIGALQLAVGMAADGVRVTTEKVGHALVLARQYRDACAAEAGGARATIEEAAKALSKPERFWQVAGAENAALLLAALPAGDKNDVFIGDDAAVKAIHAARPKVWAFSVKSARQCASDYHSSLLGSVPATCKGGTMLLTLDDLGITLWGWPNRFLARMKAADVKVIIAQDVEGDEIKGLTDMHQYADIANSFNGYIWVDKIEDLGPALKR